MSIRNRRELERKLEKKVITGETGCLVAEKNESEGEKERGEQCTEKRWLRRLIDTTYVFTKKKKFLKKKKRGKGGEASLRLIPTIPDKLRERSDIAQN